MSKIFQALNKIGAEPPELQQQPVYAPPPPVETDPSIRPARLVEWKPPAQPAAPAAAGNPAARPGLFLASTAAPPPPAGAPPQELAAGAPVVALAPRPPQRTTVRTLPVVAAAGHPILPFEDGDPQVTEGYRKVRTHLLHMESQPSVIVVSSPSQGDGKTLTAINLAGVLALKRDAAVVLVEADLRRGDIAYRCGLPEGPGLGDYLAGRCRVEDALVRIRQIPNLYVMSGGHYRENPVELLDSDRWRNLVASLRRKFRFVIIDVPPIGLLADYDLAQATADGVVVVVRQDYTNRSTLSAALTRIPPRKRLGVIMNDAAATPFHKEDAYGYYGKMAGEKGR